MSFPRKTIIDVALQYLIVLIFIYLSFFILVLGIAPNAILVSGPPGTGKTTIVKAILQGISDLNTVVQPVVFTLDCTLYSNFDQSFSNKLKHTLKQ